MGGGTYSTTNRNTRATSAGFFAKSKEQIFTQQSINAYMSPQGITIRESRDSEEHPVSLAIIIALDVTGSMGHVPHYLVKHGLPSIVGGLQQAGIADPQILFLGIGDHTCDRAPLQVGQFESSDEKLDRWLTSIYLEGGGGANEGESYLLAWYFAAHHTAIDCFEKRNQKGLLFTIGDEPGLESIAFSSLDGITGESISGGYQVDAKDTELLESARKTYEVFHIHNAYTYRGARPDVELYWKASLGQSCLMVSSQEEVASTIVETVIAAEGHIEHAPETPAPEATPLSEESAEML